MRENISAETKSCMESLSSWLIELVQHMTETDKICAENWDITSATRETVKWGLRSVDNKSAAWITRERTDFTAWLGVGRGCETCIVKPFWWFHLLNKEWLRWYLRECNDWDKQAVTGFSGRQCSALRRNQDVVKGLSSEGLKGLAYSQQEQGFRSSEHFAQSDVLWDLLRVLFRSLKLGFESSLKGPQKEPKVLGLSPGTFRNVVL